MFGCLLSLGLPPPVLNLQQLFLATPAHGLNAKTISSKILSIRTPVEQNLPDRFSIRRKFSAPLKIPSNNCEMDDSTVDHVSRGPKRFLLDDSESSSSSFKNSVISDSPTRLPIIISTSDSNLSFKKLSFSDLTSFIKLYRTIRWKCQIHTSRLSRRPFRPSH